MNDFRTWVRTELAARLELRAANTKTSVLGAGNDDLAAGRRYLAALAGSGLAVPSWPRQYGGLDATPEQVGIVRAELAAFAVPDLYPYLVGVELVARRCWRTARPSSVRGGCRTSRPARKSGVSCSPSRARAQILRASRRAPNNTATRGTCA